jgi:hypothetical protein
MAGLAGPSALTVYYLSQPANNVTVIYTVLLRQPPTSVIACDTNYQVDTDTDTDADAGYQIPDSRYQIGGDTTECAALLPLTLT